MKIFNILLLCFFLGACATSPEVVETGSPTVKEEQIRLPGEPFIILKSIICNDSKIISESLKFKPDMKLVAWGIVKTKLNGEAQVIMQIFLNLKNKEFFILENTTSGISCVISGGKYLNIFSQDRRGDKI